MVECQNITSSDAINEWIVFITGFLQREGGATPFEKLHRRITKRKAGPNTIVVLRSWRDSVKDLAQRIVNWRNGVLPRIVVVGYSYGGWSANRLCRELQGFDMPVESLLLCDPVGRIFGSLPSCFSMLDVIPLTVPANVRTLYTWRQKCDYPRGAEIRLERVFSALRHPEVNAGTMWDSRNEYPYVPHVNMDDLDHLHETVLRVVGRAE